MEKLIEALAVTSEIYGQRLSDARIRMMISDLADYAETDLLVALAACRKELRFMPTVADIMARIPGDFPSPDEAWALIPSSEADSSVWTNEIAEAYGDVQALLDDDYVGACLAFKRSYERLVSRARAERRKPVWLPTLGTDPNRRESALQDAARRGRLSQSHVDGLLPEAPRTVSPLALLAAPERMADPNDPDTLAARNRFLEKLRELKGGAK